MGYSSSFDRGNAITCTAIHQITQADINAGSVSNTATGTTAFDTTPITQSATAVVNGIQDPAITITKTATETSYGSIGDVLHYTIVLTNTGNVTLANPGLIESNATVTGCGGYTTYFDPGDAITCSAVHQITRADINAGSVSNTATGTTSFDATPITKSATAVVHGIQDPAIAIGTMATETSYSSIGDVLHYTIVLTNTGSVTLSGPFTVTDDHGTVTCPDTETLAPGASITCTMTYTITPGDVDAGKVVDTATGHASFSEMPVDSTSRSVTATLRSAESTGTEQVGGETAGPNHSATPPVTSSSGQSPAGDPSPIFGLLICLAFGALGLLAVTAQRRALRS
jgi:uncharacterized repeat protein (TIGR01451 family)